AHGLEIHRCRFHAIGDPLAAALHRVLRRDRILHLLPRRSAVDSEKAAAGIRRLLQKPERHRLHLPGAVSLRDDGREDSRVMTRRLADSALGGVCKPASIAGDKYAPWRSSSRWIAIISTSRNRRPESAASTAAMPAAWPVSQHWGISRRNVWELASQAMCRPAPIMFSI